MSCTTSDLRCRGRVLGLWLVDASGSPTTLTDEMAFRRMERAGVELTTTSAIIADLAVNWASEDGAKLIQILGEEILGADH